MSQGAKTTENTAVNRLIELAQSKPLEVDEELFLDATARAAREAAKRAVATAPPQPAPPPKPAGKSIPPPFRTTGITAVVAPLPRPSGGFPAATPAPELVPNTEPFDLADAEQIATPAPSPAPAPRPARLAPLPVSPITADESEWFQPSQAVEKYDEEYLVGTRGVPKQGGSHTVWYVAGAFGLGLALAAVFFWPRARTTPAPRSAEVAAGLAPVAEPVTPAPTITAAPALAPTVEALPTAEPAPAPVTAVRFESSPAGASVVLVVDGQMTPLGAAPVEHVLEPGQRYEVMFTLEGHASLIVPLAGGTAERVAATMGASTSTATVVKVAAPAVAAAAAPAVVEEEVVEEEEEVAPPPAVTKPAPKAPAKKKVAKVEPKAKAKAAPAASGGTGTLKIGAKPPCDVLIDGKKVGTSPIANLTVSAGRHSITLINREFGIKEKVSVTVKAGETVKVVKDLTNKMK